MATSLAELRKLVPKRPLTTNEAMRIVELQASRLLELAGVTAPPVPDTVVSGLQRVRIDRFDGERVSGFYEWIGGRWVLAVNEKDAPVRNRFTLLHETFHVLNYPFAKLVYPPRFGMSSRDREERMADYFAACALMPRTWVKRDWGAGMQDVGRLAYRYGVSRRAMTRRLVQLGLSEPEERCGNYVEYREGAA
jgi:Zn-dependent peptidase ImmA (M78 family)